MARIHRMDEHLTNMIAAGEVVERPMGIVKECVENAIDAQATRIEVWITQGGIEEIEIIDNGIGMDAQDAIMAFERHATSKIKSVQDLWSIATLGFRGEALPSIASVSQVELRTCNGEEATRVVIHYGEITKTEPFGCNPGTSLIIRGLFQKTPARLKHLKSAQYETALISDVMQKFALSHPEIAFRLVAEGRETFKTTGSGQLQEVLYAIYGKEAAKNSFEITGEDYDTRIHGLGVLPHISRANRNYITLFINQRMIRSFKLQKAIVDAYHRYMPQERFPIVVMHIELDEQLVDVNVHPSKWEIRLSKEQQLTLLVQETMQRSLEKHMTAPKVEKIAAQPIYVEQPQLFDKPMLQVQENKAEYGGKQTNETPINQGENRQGEVLVTKLKQTSWNEKPQHKLSEEEIRSLYPVDKIEESGFEAEQPKETVKIANSLPKMEALAQLHGRYILASCDEGLIIIDQHAAQERANYERFLKIFEEKQGTMVDLLVPLCIETTASIIAQIDELNRLFLDLSIEFEVFSDNSLLVRSIPLWMQQLDEMAFLQDCLDSFAQENSLAKKELNKDRIATQACHHSIRFNRTLTKEEMDQVILDLEACEQPFHCPHGRPTMITITEAQLIKEFKR